MRPPRRRHLRLTLFALAVLPLLAACSRPGIAVGRSADPRPDVVAVGTLPPPATAGPRWRRSFVGPVRISLAPDGSVATVLGPDGLTVVGPSGGMLWRAGPGGVAIAVGHGLVVRGPAPADDGGALRLYNGAGTLIWQQPGVGPLAAAASADGDRVAIADGGAGLVWLIDSNPADAPAGARSVPIAGPARLQFTGRDRLVIDDGVGVSVVSRHGRLKTLCPGGCSGPSRSIAAASNAAWLAVATRGGDNTLYMFRSDGTAIWHRSLPSGGGDGLVVGPRDRQLLLVDLGAAGDLADIAAASGAERWALDLRRGGQFLPAVAAAFVPGGGALVLARRAAGTYVIAVDTSGRPRAALSLPARAAVDLTGARDGALALTDNTSGRARVAWYSLQAAAGR